MARGCFLRSTISRSLKSRRSSSIGVSASLALFGKNAFAARLPSALFTLATALLLVSVGRRINDPRLGRYGALVYLSMLFPAVLAHAVLLDGALNFFIAVSVLSFFLWTRGGQKRDALLSLFAAGIAVSIKGPVGAVIPLVVVLLDGLLARDLLARIRSFPWKWGVPCFLLGAMPWYLLVSMVYGASFVERFIAIENVGRFSHAMEGHSGGWYYYLFVLVLSGLPWSAWLPWWMRNTLSLRKDEDGQTRLSRLGLVWTLSIIILFTFSQTKLSHYISSVYPAMALGIAALWLRQGPSPAWMKRSWRMLAIISLPIALALMAMPVFSPYLSGIATHPRAFAIFAQRIKPGLAMPVAGAVIVAALFALLSFMRQDGTNKTLAHTVLFGFLFQSAIIWSVAPWAGRMMQGDALEIAARIRASSPSTPVYSFVNRPSIAFYSDRTVLDADAAELASSSKPFLLVAFQGNLKDLAHLPLEIVYQHNGLALLQCR